MVFPLIKHKEVAKSVLEDVKLKYHPVGTDTPKAILDHEIGHQLDDLLHISDNSKIVSMYIRLTKEEITEQLSRYAWDNGNKNPIREFVPRHGGSMSTPKKRAHLRKP